MTPLISPPIKSPPPVVNICRHARFPFVFAYFSELVLEFVTRINECIDDVILGVCMACRFVYADTVEAISRLAEEVIVGHITFPGLVPDA